MIWAFDRTSPLFPSVPPALPPRPSSHPFLPTLPPVCPPLRWPLSSLGGQRLPPLAPEFSRGSTLALFALFARSLLSRLPSVHLLATRASRPIIPQVSLPFSLFRFDLLISLGWTRSRIHPPSLASHSSRSTSPPSFPPLALEFTRGFNVHHPHLPSVGP